MAKQNWLIYKVGTEQLILTDDNEKSIRAILLDRYQPFTVIDVIDYLSGNLIESLPLNALYNEV